MLEGAREEALLAVALYNQPLQPRRLEGFFIHMHLAWLYLLHAEFKRDGVDFRYRLPNGRFQRVDGEPKTWQLTRCVEERWPEQTAVRKNLELTIALRNKIEHRYHEAIALATSGYAQALLLNFEEELTSAFGPSFSLGEHLRFPIFVGSLTALGRARIEEMHDYLPAMTRDFIARFEADLDPAIVQDQRYEFRVYLIPKLGPKSEADRALTFVREDELTPEARQAVGELGRSGIVLVRERIRGLASAGLMRPRTAASRIEERIPFKFSLYSHFSRAWRKLGCRPQAGSAHPERTDERYCVYDEPHGDYLYTPAFVEKVVSESSTAEKFRVFTGLSPVPKVKAQSSSLE